MATKTFRSILLLLPKTNFQKNFTRKSSQCSIIGLCPEVEDLFNDQINAELFAGYNYLAMATFFERQNVTLKGCRMFCMDQVKEQEHALKLINYVNIRGGRVCLDLVEAPATQEWSSPVLVFKDALKLEDKVTEKILHLHKITQDCNDLASSTWLEEHFVHEQVESLDQISRYVAWIERMGPEGLGVQIFDEYLLQEFETKSKSKRKHKHKHKHKHKKYYFY